VTVIVVRPFPVRAGTLVRVGRMQMNHRRVRVVSGPGVIVGDLRVEVLAGQPDEAHQEGRAEHRCTEIPHGL